MVAGLEEPSSGRITIGERDVTDVPAKDRDLAMVFQNYALYPHMSVYDNMAFGLRMRKYAKSEIDTLVRDVALALGIDPLLSRKPGELSGGQQQRVALGRAIVRRPLAFLMDEPLSNLDAKMRVQTRAELIRLHRELGGTFIYVTHDQVEAMTMSERVAVLDGGELQQVGPPQEVYDTPANLFVAEFIGSPAMNFLSAEAVQRDGTFGLQAEDALVRPSPEQAAALQRQGVKSVVIGIRPEHVVPLDAEQGEAAATFDGTVDVVEHLGSEQHVTVTLPHSSLAVRLPSDARYEAGAAIKLSVRAEHLHLFDAQSKQRMSS